ncbi:MAG: hypothetical protein HY329_17195 [Chloroflexi bacterium]|nr:hypothetical protein [Chloroflexota bacterium]
MRLSLLYALLDRSNVVRFEHLEAALELWNYAERSVEYLFGNATGDPVADAIVTALKQNGQLTQTQISDLFGRHESASRINVALQALVARGLAQVSQRDTGGRPQQIWTPA